MGTSTSNDRAKPRYLYHHDYGDDPPEQSTIRSPPPPAPPPTSESSHPTPPTHHTPTTPNDVHNNTTNQSTPSNATPYQPPATQTTEPTSDITNNSTEMTIHTDSTTDTQKPTDPVEPTEPAYPIHWDGEETLEQGRQNLHNPRPPLTGEALQQALTYKHPSWLQSEEYAQLQIEIAEWKATKATRQDDDSEDTEPAIPIHWDGEDPLPTRTPPQNTPLQPPAHHSQPHPATTTTPNHPANHPTTPSPTHTYDTSNTPPPQDSTQPHPSPASHDRAPEHQPPPNIPTPTSTRTSQTSIGTSSTHDSKLTDPKLTDPHATPLLKLRKPNTNLSLPQRKRTKRQDDFHTLLHHITHNQHRHTGAQAHRDSRFLQPSPVAAPRPPSSDSAKTMPTKPSKQGTRMRSKAKPTPLMPTFDHQHPTKPTSTKPKPPPPPTATNQTTPTTGKAHSVPAVITPRKHQPMANPYKSPTSITIARTAAAHASPNPSATSPTPTTTSTRRPARLPLSRPTVACLLLQIPHQEGMPELTTTILHDIFSTTLRAHSSRVPIVVTISNITYKETKPRGGRFQGSHAHYYELALSPAQTPDQFDHDIFRAQAFDIGIQQWHRYGPTVFAPDGSKLDHAPITPPSHNPWTEHINVLYPACNSFNEQARGILLGLPADYYGNHRFACLSITDSIYDHLLPHIPTEGELSPLTNRYTFHDNIGVRSTFYNKSTTRGKKSGQDAIVYFLHTSRLDIWQWVHTTILHTAGPFFHYGQEVITVPIPESNPTNTTPASKNHPPTRAVIVDSTLKISNDLRPMYAVPTTRLRLNTKEDIQTLFRTTKHLVIAVPVFGCDHDLSPTAHLLYFKANPSSLHITVATVHSIIDAELLLPEPSPEQWAPYVQAAAAPATPPTPHLSPQDAIWKKILNQNGLTEPEPDQQPNSPTDDPTTEEASLDTATAMTETSTAPTTPTSTAPSANKRKHPTHNLASTNPFQLLSTEDSDPEDEQEDDPMQDDAAMQDDTADPDTQEPNPPEPDWESYDLSQTASIQLQVMHEHIKETVPQHLPALNQEIQNAVNEYTEGDPSRLTALLEGQTAPFLL